MWQAGSRAESSAGAGRGQPGAQERQGRREGRARQGASAGGTASGTWRGAGEAGPPCKTLDGLCSQPFVGFRMVPSDAGRIPAQPPLCPPQPPSPARPGSGPGPGGRAQSLLLEGGLQLLEGRLSLLHLLRLLLPLLLLGLDLLLEAAGHVDGLDLGGGRRGLRAGGVSTWPFSGVLPAMPTQLPLSLPPTLGWALHSLLGPRFLQ